MLASIIGWGHLPFGKLAGATVESMICDVAVAAIADADVAPSEIDEIYLGHFNAGFSTQDFTAALALEVSPDLRFKPVTRVENACATGSAAVHLGRKSILSGEARTVLVIGVEKMSHVAGPEIGQLLLRAAYLPEEEGTKGFAGLFGRVASAYFERYGDKSDALAAIAAKNHRNGVSNPYAQMRTDLGYDFCRTVSDQNPIVAGPLRRTDCSLVSDGAAAIVLASEDRAATAGKSVRIRAAAHAQDYLPIRNRDPIAMEGCTIAWNRALEAAELSLADLSFVETHDCFTIAELIEYEAMGLTPHGKGEVAIKEGWTEMSGRLPVNPSGGLKAKGHPIGATGVSMHALAAMQLTGAAPEGMQIHGAKLGGIFNMGGLGVANYVSILERTR